jgi:hypothetical protein
MNVTDTVGMCIMDITNATVIMDTDVIEGSMDITDVRVINNMGTSWASHTCGATREFHGYQSNQRHHGHH